MNAIATQNPNLLPVHRYEEIEGQRWLEIQVSGWDDVEKHTKDILVFKDREYGWSCWNSDRMVSVFRSPPFDRYARVKGKAPR